MYHTGEGQACAAPHTTYNLIKALALPMSRHAKMRSNVDKQELHKYSSCHPRTVPLRQSVQRACWFRSRCWVTRQYISDMLKYQAGDLHCTLHRLGTSSCRGHDDGSMLLHRERGTAECRVPTDVKLLRSRIDRHTYSTSSTENVAV